MTMGFPQPTSVEGDTKQKTPDAQVDEICVFWRDRIVSDLKHSLAHCRPEDRHVFKLPQFKFKDGGYGGFVITAVTREDFNGLLKPLRSMLSDLMLRMPRSKGETLEAYAERLRKSEVDSGRWWSRFQRIGELMAHLQRLDEEEAAERKLEAEIKRQEEERKRQRELEERRKLEREASPDPAEIKRLLAVIAEAEEIERLLKLRNKANEAREALFDIYEKERNACRELGRPAPQRSGPMSQPAVKEPHYIFDVPKQPRSSGDSTLRTARR
jgi:hypothetical protein